MQEDDGVHVSVFSKSGLRFKRGFLRFREDRRGVAAVIVALTLPALLGAVGLVTDAGFWYGTQQSLQCSATAAAMAVARASAYGVTSSSALAQVATQNAADASSIDSSVTTSYTASSASRFSAVSTAPGPVFFSEILGVNAPSIAAGAAAVTVTPSTGDTLIYNAG